MHLQELDDQSAVVRLSVQDLILLNNALNEVCYGIDVPAFETRLGASRQIAEGLLEEISLIVQKIEGGAARRL